MDRLLDGTGPFSRSETHLYSSHPCHPCIIKAQQLRWCLLVPHPQFCIHVIPSPPPPPMPPASFGWYAVLCIYVSIQKASWAPTYRPAPCPCPCPCPLAKSIHIHEHEWEGCSRETPEHEDTSNAPHATKSRSHRFPPLRATPDSFNHCAF